MCDHHHPNAGVWKAFRGSRGDEAGAGHGGGRGDGGRADGGVREEGVWAVHERLRGGRRGGRPPETGARVPFNRSVTNGKKKQQGALSADSVLRNTYGTY